MKNRFSGKKNTRLFRLISAFAVLLALGGIVFISLHRGASLFHERVGNTKEEVSILDLWNRGEYAAVAQIAEERLRISPMDRDALLYAGYSRFFLAVSKISAEERLADLDKSIVHLRRLRARKDTPHPERVDYVLGKAYLFKGPYWADLSVEYLGSSLEKGYKAEDSYEYLGRAYSAIGDLQQALKWYELAAESHPTDRLLITLGEEAFKLGEYNTAAGYYRRAIDGTKDESLEKRGLSQLGQLYYDVGNYIMAREVLEKLVGMEPGNADYQFLLAETYHELGFENEARKTWFAVTRINPAHVGALRRLYD